MEQQWEETEKILSWREMRLGVYRYHGNIVAQPITAGR